MASDWLNDAIKDAVSEYGDVPPPWAQFPSYSRYSMGWRMGSGESWLSIWGTWKQESLAPDRPTRLAYLKRNRIAPINWAESVWRTLMPDGPEYDDEVHDELLLQWSLIGEDAAFENWVAMHDAPPLPWSDSEEGTPASYARYWTREMSFWCRYISTKRTNLLGNIPTSSVPASWHAFFIACLTGDVVNQSMAQKLNLQYTQPESAGLHQLACEMAANGHPTPPWVLGYDVETYGENYDQETMTYADAWVMWAFDVFDDGPSWRNYFQGHGPIDVGWEKYIKTDLLLF